MHRRCSELIIIDFHCFARLFITAKQKLTDIFDDDDDDDDGDDDDDELFHGLVGWWICDKRSEVLTFANLCHGACKIQTFAEPKFKLCWRKLCSTLAPLGKNCDLLILKAFTVALPKYLSTQYFAIRIAQCKNNKFDSIKAGTVKMFKLKLQIMMQTLENF